MAIFLARPEAQLLPAGQNLAETRRLGAALVERLACSCGFWDHFKESIDDTILKLRMVAVFAIFGHAVYFLIWTYVFPQPFESIGLRIFCFSLGLCLYFLVSRRMGGTLFYVFTYLCILVNVPFFFFYMMLQNGAASVWLQSCVCALLYLAWITDPRNYAVMTVVGFAAAFLAHAASPAAQASLHDWLSSLPVMAFAFASGFFFRTAEERTIAGNRARSVALAGCIAHELRTPLLGTRLDLATASRKAEAAGPLGDEFRDAFARIDRHLLKATHVIDTLLRNVTSEKIDSSRFDVHWASAAVHEALSRYPFTARERSLVTVSIDGDFQYRGDDVLLVHAIMNLMKNALTSISAVQRGTVEISVIADGPVNRIVVRDSGGGIDPGLGERLFMEFASGTRGGAGLGLAFCRRVARAFSGRIACRSRRGEFAEFTITLPAPRSAS